MQTDGRARTAVKDVRTRMLGIIQRRGGATVDELAGEVELAPATVRHHLDVLQRDALVSYLPEHGGVGRPRYVFRLTAAGEELRPRGYDRLARQVIAEIGDLTRIDLGGLSDGGSLIDLVVERIAAEKAQGYAGRVADLSLEEKVNETVQILNEEDYAADVQPSPEGYAITMHNCPYHLVAEGNLQLCELETQFARSLIGSEVVRGATQAEGATACSMVVRRATAHE